MKKISEKQVEQYLVKRVKEMGGIAYKFTSPQRRNVPDRLCIFPDGKACFIECKAPGKKPTDGQKREMQRIAELLHRVSWVDSYQSVDAFLQTI